VGLVRRNKIWWFTKQHKGKRIQESLGTESKKLAEKLHAEKLIKISDGSYFEISKRDITFSELSDRYMQKHSKERDPYSLKRLLPVFGQMLTEDIDIEDVENYIDDRLMEVAHSTVYKEFALGRRMFNVARKKWGKEFNILRNPFADAGFPHFENARDRWLTVEEENKLLSCASPQWLQDLIIFAIHTGCRKSEILNIYVKSDIDMKRRVVTVQATKKGNRKVIPMSDKLFEMLSHRLKVISISGKLFDVTVAAQKDAFDRAVEKAKLENLHFHDLRHTFATRLVQMGVSLFTVQKLMGHKSISMTERYAHHCPESLRPAVMALNSYYNSATMQDDRNSEMSQSVVKCLINQ
jgi:integrase